jgi:hypothetical protein
VSTQTSYLLSESVVSDLLEGVYYLISRTVAGIDSSSRIGEILQKIPTPQFSTKFRRTEFRFIHLMELNKKTMKMVIFPLRMAYFCIENTRSMHDYLQFLKIFLVEPSE